LIELEWQKCVGGIWCELNKIDENHENLDDVEGIYIIWSGKPPEERSVLKVGYEDIRKIIIECRQDLAVQAFNNHKIFITWSDDFPGSKRKHILAYLAKTLEPKISERNIKAKPVDVNLPWDET
jgi:hypothetical protein